MIGLCKEESTEEFRTTPEGNWHVQCTKLVYVNKMKMKWMIFGKEKMTHENKCPER